ncbi:hypothetical protein CFC21_023750 [Triticum aestivum]|uniref:Uncharacterized protein n=2 Tax=Triticum aestivum TaxID=4565 RepID=A0A3B6C7A0_WHEAT|nr:uncharacterized protein LOC123045450 [Triticum aestivum]KAF7009163.1 hypothetical protein CFC21_023750 [Triticum aestivum]
MHGRLQSTSSLWCSGRRHQRVGDRPRPQRVGDDTCSWCYTHGFWHNSKHSGTSIHITWVAMKDVFPSQVDKCVEIGLPELILMVAFSQVLQIKLYMQLMGLHDSHFNISSWKPLSVSMNNCCWSVACLHCLVGYFLHGVVEEFSEARFILRATFSLSFY